MKKITVIIFLSIILASCGQDPQPKDSDKERINLVCDKCVQAFSHQRIALAMQFLKQNSVMSSASIDTLEATINKQDSTIFQEFGKMLSTEFITERKVKNIIAKRLYILRLEKYYLKFSFTLYNNGKKWTITRFDYSEDIDEMLN